MSELTYEERKEAYRQKRLTVGREEKRQEANEIRDYYLNKDFEYRGSMFQCDDVSVRNMTTTKMTLPNGSIIQWRDSNNVNHPFSDGDIESMLQIISARGNEVYEASWKVKEYIEQSDDPDSIDVKALYRDCYNA